jgi:predicted lipoprotein
MRRSIGTALAVMLIAGCSDTVSPGGGDTPLTAIQTAILNELPSGVILATYQDLDTKAAALVQSVAALQANSSDANLDAARAAWQATRRPWEQSEGFLFGPVETKGIDPKIDSWPVNRADLDAVLASPDALTATYVSGLDETLQGFHTIEYLLWGTGAKTASQLTARELEYLTATVTILKQATANLLAAWSPGGENFIRNLQTAGQAGNAVYPSQIAALQELVNGVIGIANEVGTGKIADPFDQQDRTLEESQFSNNSNTDFADNIRSIDNIYRGVFGSTTVSGLTALVRAKNATLDDRVKSEINDAIAKIGQMTPTFGSAITTNRAAVQAAQDAVLKLKQSLESDVLPLLN